MAEELHSAVASRLRDDDQRYTSNRRSLVEVLEASERPLTIAEIIGQRALAQSSVYRNLTVLENAHVVHRVTSTDDFARYELAEDLTDHHHHHLICSTCGTVADFTVSAQLERTLERAMSGVEAETGFRPEHHRLDLVGVCGDCH
jgi:Fur family ferric uptake transcriptional regulator